MVNPRTSSSNDAAPRPTSPRCDRQGSAGGSQAQEEIVYDEGHGISTKSQQYDPTPLINLLRTMVDAWRSILRSYTSREFRKPESGRIAVKVINHLGDEVMKVFRVE